MKTTFMTFFKQRKFLIYSKSQYNVKNDWSRKFHDFLPTCIVKMRQSLFYHYYESMSTSMLGGRKAEKEEDQST